jgi:hypothetical protein
MHNITRSTGAVKTVFQNFFQKIKYRFNKTAEAVSLG